MANKTFLKEALEALRDAIDTKLKVSMGLETVQCGGLEIYPKGYKLSDDIPLILIKMIEPTLGEIANIIGDYDWKYYFRFIYVREFADNEEAYLKKIEEFSKLLEELATPKFLEDNFPLLIGSQIMQETVIRIHPEPPEEMAFLNYLGADLSVCAVDYFVGIQNLE